jgi:K+-sensing histidine kinase KdpD
VLFAATRGGAIPAIVTALGAIGAAAFFFYPPIYDFRVHSPVHLIDIALFIVVAAVTGKLAIDARRAKLREQADALREALIGSVSHELRSPLSSIVGSASILATSPEIIANARALSLVHGVQEEADRLNDHIQNLLDSTRISSEGVRPLAEWVDPGDIITTAIERKRRLLSTHHVDLAVESDLPMVHVDPLLIEKALGHLLENAAKYSPADSPIEIRAERFDGMVRLAVRDKGAGLSCDEERRISDRFYRSPRHRNVSGAGLGLWIAHALVTACGGHVEAFSLGHWTGVDAVAVPAGAPRRGACRARGCGAVTFTKPSVARGT